jgi:hypothetical protein
MKAADEIERPVSGSGKITLTGNELAYARIAGGELSTSNRRHVPSKRSLILLNSGGMEPLRRSELVATLAISET